MYFNYPLNKINIKRRGYIRFEDFIYFKNHVNKLHYAFVTDSWIRPNFIHNRKYKNKENKYIYLICG